MSSNLSSSRLAAPRLVVEASDVLASAAYSGPYAEAMGSSSADPLGGSIRFDGKPYQQVDGSFNLPALPGYTDASSFASSSRGQSLVLTASSAMPPQGATLSSQRAAASSSMDPGARGTAAVTWTASHGFRPSLGHAAGASATGTAGRAGDGSGTASGNPGNQAGAGFWEGQGEALYAEMASTGKFVRVRGGRAQEPAPKPRPPPPPPRAGGEGATPMDVLGRPLRMPWSMGIEAALLGATDLGTAVLAGFALALALVSAREASDAAFISTSALFSGTARTVMVTLASISILGAAHSMGLCSRPLAASLRTAGSLPVAQEAFDRRQAAMAQGRSVDPADSDLALPAPASAFVAPASTGLQAARLSVLLLLIGGHLATLLTGPAESLVSAASGQSAAEVQSNAAASQSTEALDRVSAFRAATGARAALFVIAAVVHAVVYRQLQDDIRSSRAIAVHRFAQRRWGADALSS